MVDWRECPNLHTIFKAEVVNQTLCAPDQPLTQQGEEGYVWNNYLLYIYPQNFVTSLAMFLTKSHRVLPLKLNDIRDQMAKDPLGYAVTESGTTSTLYAEARASRPGASTSTNTHSGCRR